MIMRRYLMLVVLLISACTPALPEITKSAEIEKVKMTVQGEASPTTEPSQQVDHVPPEPTITVNPGGLLPSSELHSYCLPWLDEPSSPSNSIRLQNGIKEGDTAVDFYLKDVHGATHRLADLLETKPVLLILGGYT